MSAMLIDDVPITTAMYVRDLGIYLDRDLSMRTHVQRTVSRCFAALRQLRRIGHCVPASTSQTLVVALIHSRLDYGNSVLVGLPVYLMRRSQTVLNAAARLIFHLRRSDHISDALKCPHWLRVPERVEFKIAVLTHKVLCGIAPRYLGLLNRVITDISGRRSLRSSGTNRLVVPPFRLSTVGSRAFPVAAAKIWNALPDSLVSITSPSSFRHHLKIFLFQRSFS